MAYSMSAYDIMQDAHVMCGGLEDDENMSASQQAFALRALNRMVKAWSRKGMKIWKQTEITVPLVANQTAYTIGLGGDVDIEKPVRIFNPRKVDALGIETPMLQVSRQEFYNQPNRTVPGTPIHVYYDSQLNQGILNVWPVPDPVVVTPPYPTIVEVRMTVKEYLDDITIAQDDVRFPPEWLDALVYNLAVRLCPLYEVTGDDKAVLMQMAASFLAEAEYADQEFTSLFISPRSEDYDHYGEFWGED